MSSILTSAQKEEALKRLAVKRQQEPFEGYYCLHEFHDGIYECEYVSPWSKCAHNVDTSIMFVGQDWAGEDELRRPVNDYLVQHGYDRGPTTRNLKRLLKDHFSKEFSDVYATNAFPFIKPAGTSAPVPPDHMKKAVEEFLLPQIEIIQPQIVICLGKNAFNAVGKSRGRKKLERLDDALMAAFDFGSSKIVVVAHTGARGTNTRNKGDPDRADKDWASIRRLFDELNKSKGNRTRERNSWHASQSSPVGLRELVKPSARR